MVEQWQKRADFLISDYKYREGDIVAGHHFSTIAGAELGLIPVGLSYEDGERRYIQGNPRIYEADGILVSGRGGVPIGTPPNAIVVRGDQGIDAVEKSIASNFGRAMLRGSVSVVASAFHEDVKALYRFYDIYDELVADPVGAIPAVSRVACKVSNAKIEAIKEAVIGMGGATFPTNVKPVAVSVSANHLKHPGIGIFVPEPYAKTPVVSLIPIGRGQRELVVGSSALGYWGFNQYIIQTGIPGVKEPARVITAKVPGINQGLALPGLPVLRKEGVFDANVTTLPDDAVGVMNHAVGEARAAAMDLRLEEIVVVGEERMKSPDAIHVLGAGLNDAGLAATSGAWNGMRILNFGIALPIDKLVWDTDLYATDKVIVAANLDQATDPWGPRGANGVLAGK